MAALTALLAAGWRVGDDGEIWYLPLGDDDAFAWTHVPVSRMSTVMEEIKTKAERGELVGVVLTFENTMIGGEWLFYTDGTNSVTFSVSINRRSLPTHTDVGWYLDRILPALQRHHIIVESWRWAEHV